MLLRSLGWIMTIVFKVIFSLMLLPAVSCHASELLARKKIKNRERSQSFPGVKTKGSRRVSRLKFLSKESRTFE